MKTYNQFLNTPFSEEIKPPEPQEEDPGIKSKEKRQMQIKKMVLLKKLQAVRAGAGTDIVAGYEPEGDQLDERLGGKGYKPYTSLTGKKVSGDWEDSDRGAGNKAKKRAGGKVEKKSPTYRAHVLNKEEVEDLNEYSPNVTYQAKGGRKSGKLGKSSVYSLKDKGESKKEFRKSQVKDIKGGYLKTEEVVDEGIKKAIKKGVRIAKRVAKDATSPYDPGGYTTIGSLGNPHLGNEEKRKKERAAKKKVSEGTDKAFEYVKKQIAAKYGKSGYVSKDNPRKPQTAAEKKKVAAHKAKLAKQDHRDPTEKASDGRYSDRHSNRGSD